MTTQSVLRYVAGTKRSQAAAIHLLCHVKPGTNKSREGVIALTDSAVELCVSAQPREGEANRAVTLLVSKVLGIPKSDVQITHGLKSRDKTVAVTGVLAQGDESACISRVRDLLEEAVTST